MSQTYEQRLTTVEGALTDQKITPAAGHRLTEVVAAVLHVLDHIPNSSADQGRPRRLPERRGELNPMPPLNCYGGRESRPQFLRTKARLWRFAAARGTCRRRLGG